MPVTTAGEWPLYFEYWSMIHAITCSLVPMSGAGTFWLFGDNSDYLGGMTLAQESVVAVQAHLVYSFRPGLWYSERQQVQMPAFGRTLSPAQWDALADYMTDPTVDDHAALIVWHNPDLRPA